MGKECYLKKEMFVAVALLTILFAFAGCRTVPSGETPPETAAALKLASTGTQGVVARFLPGFPPAQVYSDNQLVVLLELRNRGRYTLPPQECIVDISGFDQSILSIPDSRQSCTALDGKSAFNLEGGFTQLEFKSSYINLPSGTTSYEPPLHARICYYYETESNPEVCVDPVFYQVSSEQKACVVRNPDVGGGQAAPVAVTWVRTEMTGGKALFEINVANVGGGRVISPFTGLSLCPDSLGYADFDKVLYTVSMSGGTLLSCKPDNGMVTLFNGNGRIFCQFAIHGNSAYETPLNIKLQYNYLDSVQQTVNVIKTPI